MKKIMAGLLAFAFLACVGTLAFAAGDEGAGLVIYRDVDIEFSFYSIMNLSDDAISSPEATYSYTLTPVTVDSNDSETIYGVTTSTGVMPEIAGEMGQASTQVESLEETLIFTAMDYASTDSTVTKFAQFSFSATFDDAGVYHYLITEEKDSSSNSYITDDPNTTRDVYLVIGWADVTENENPYLELKSVLMYDSTYTQAHSEAESDAQNTNESAAGEAIAVDKSTGFTHSYGVVPTITADENGYTCTPGVAGSQGQDFHIGALSFFGDLASANNDMYVTVTIDLPDGYIVKLTTNFNYPDYVYQWETYYYVLNGKLYEAYQTSENIYGYYTWETSFRLNSYTSYTFYSVGAEATFTVTMTDDYKNYYESEGYTVYARAYQWGDDETANVESTYTDAPTATGTDAAIVNDKSDNSSIAFAAQGGSWSQLTSASADQDPYIYAYDGTTWYQDNGGISFAIVRGNGIGQGDDEGITYTPFTNTGINLEIIPFACMALFATACITLRIARKSHKKRGST